MTEWNTTKVDGAKLARLWLSSAWKESREELREELKVEVADYLLCEISSR